MPDSLPWDHFTNEAPVSSSSAEPVVVIGAGLAGCWCARTLAEAGVDVVVMEAGKTPAAGASSNPAGIVKPFVTRSPSHAMSFYVEAHRYLLAQLVAWELAGPSNFQACGVVQLVEKAYPDSEHYSPITPDQMQRTIGVQSDSHGLLFEASGWLNPSALCHRLLQHQRISLRCQSSVVAVEPFTGDTWQVHLEVGAAGTGCNGVADDGESILSPGSTGSNQATERAESLEETTGIEHALTTGHVVIATGAVLDRLTLTSGLTITPARGQISRFKVTPSSKGKLERVVSGNHYIIPDGESVIVGASFERGVSNNQIRSNDDEANKTGASKTLVSLNLSGEPLESFAGVRATTPDRLPLVGPLPDKVACERVYADLHHGRPLANYDSLPVHKGIFVLGGLGSRGIVTAPFASRLLVDFMMGTGDILHWSSLINPARFQIRRLKRGRNE